MSATLWVLPAESERERVLLATAEIWSQEGYEALDRTAICLRAGVDEGRFGGIFADVDAAAVATNEVPLEGVVRLVASRYSPDRSEAESYAVAIHGMLHLMAANPAYAYVAYIAGRQMAPPGVHSVFQAGHRFLVAMLDRLWAGSLLNRQPPRAALGALGSAEAVVRREVAAGRYSRLPGLAPQFIYAAVVPFLGQEEALRQARLAGRVPSDPQE